MQVYKKNINAFGYSGLNNLRLYKSNGNNNLSNLAQKQFTTKNRTIARASNTGKNIWTKQVANDILKADNLKPKKDLSIRSIDKFKNKIDIFA